ncbi:hypothetical protein E2C01_027264 [Portunus trituberculatus]|uniref:Uncharacterized protein n=1 Tax=Portunus trituberculatus TaxID=210409 RepID=A0A5B7EL31_PORTR|nr:hypothetical protein [Portunus trituberculatus]
MRLNPYRKSRAGEEGYCTRKDGKEGRYNARDLVKCCCLKKLSLSRSKHWRRRRRSVVWVREPPTGGAFEPRRATHEFRGSYRFSPSWFQFSDGPGRAGRYVSLSVLW